MTKAVYDFNGDAFQNRIAENILFWAFLILPVYGIAMLGDAVIFNLIEFWTGETLDVAQEVHPDGTKVVLQPGSDSRTEAQLVVTAPDGQQHMLRFVKSDEDLFRVLDETGRAVGFVARQDDGTIHLQDADHRLVRVIDAPAFMR